MPSPFAKDRLAKVRALPRVFNGRLTLLSATPVAQQDQIGKTNLYFTPYKGDQISLFDGAGAWNTRSFTEITLPLGTLTNATIYDVFLYDNGGTVTADGFVAWRNSGLAITGATNATPIVITANSHGVSNGDEVYVTGVQTNTGANGTWIAASVAANTITLTGSVGNGTYTAGTGQLSARATLLTLQNGVPVKAGATTRLYVGSFLTTATTTTEDSLLNRYVWNYYNRTGRRLLKTDSTSHNYTSATIRQWNGSTANQFNFLLGVGEDGITVAGYNNGSNPATQYSVAGIALNNIVAFDTFGYSEANGSPTVSGIYGFGKAFLPAAGKHYIAVLEQSAAGGTTTFSAFDVSAIINN